MEECRGHQQLHAQLIDYRVLALYLDESSRVLQIRTENAGELVDAIGQQEGRRRDESPRNC